MIENIPPVMTREDARMIRLAALAVEEAEALLALLPVALEVRWDRAKAGLGEPDGTGRRATGGHSDPTADIAADPARLHLSHVVKRGEVHLATAAASLRGLRRGLERAMVRWEGPEDTDPATAV